MTDDQMQTLWLGALRYYMGRTTYAVTDFCDLLIFEWPNIPTYTQRLIQRDLMAEIKHDNTARELSDNKMSYQKCLGHDCDRAAWDRVAKLWEVK